MLTKLDNINSIHKTNNKKLVLSIFFQECFVWVVGVGLVVFDGVEEGDDVGPVMIDDVDEGEEGEDVEDVEDGEDVEDDGPFVIEGVDDVDDLDEIITLFTQ